MTTIDRPTDQTPCPSWCDDGTEYHEEWETEVSTGHQVRTHSLDVGSVWGASPDRTGEKQASASVDVVAIERAQVGESGVGVALDRPRVAIWAEYVLIDAPTARQLAALLIAGADRLDAILGGL